jgi:hypothetical protein
MRLKTTTIAGLAGAMLAVGAPVATAQSTDPVQDGYSTPSGVVQTQIENNTPKRHSVPAAETSTPKATVQQPANSQLPFTGLDIGLVLAAGAMLLAAGLGIRRVTRPAGSV